VNIYYKGKIQDLRKTNLGLEHQCRVKREKRTYH